MELFKNRYFSLIEISEKVLECNVFNVDATDTEIDDFLSVGSKILAENNRRITIYRLKDIKLMKVEHRLTIGNWTKKNKDIIKKNTIGNVYITDSIISKMVLNLIFLVEKPVFPYLITKDESEAQTWIAGMLKNEPIM